MSASKSLSKRLDELRFGEGRVVTVRSSLNLPAEFLLPFLLQQRQVGLGVPALLVTLSEAPANFVYLSKRVGLNLNKLKNVELVDGLAIISSLVESHYPLTKQPPFTHAIGPNGSTEAAPNIHEGIGRIKKIIAEFKGRNPQGIVAISGLEVLENLITTGPNQPDSESLFSLIYFVLKLAPHVTFLCFDESLKRTNSSLVNFLRSTAEIDLRLKDVQSGFSTDYAGTLEIRDCTGRFGKNAIKRLKAVITNGTIDFVDQIKIA
jgi:hypothetical protein